MSTITNQKQKLRQRLKQARLEINEEDRCSYNGSIYRRFFSLAQVKSAKTLFCFISNGSEVETHPIINQLLNDGKSVVVPKIIDRQPMIAVSFSGWKDVLPGQLGILSPTSSEPAQNKIDICITPGLGFSITGQRLGFGRGYYDMWFSKNRVTTKIALSYECQLVENLPTNETDVAMNLIVTEERIINT